MRRNLPAQPTRARRRRGTAGTVRRDAHAVHGLRALADEVPAPHVDRIEARALGELVELALEREARLHRAVTALRAARGLVREEPRRVEAIRRQRVRRGEQLAGVVRGHEAERAVRAAVELHERVGAGDHAVGVHAGAVAQAHRMAAAVRVEHFLARVDDLHRAARDHGQLRGPRTRARTARSFRRSRRPRRAGSRARAASAGSAPSRGRGAGSARPGCSTTP